MEYETVSETAKRLGVSRQYIRFLLATNRMEGEKVSSGWLIPKGQSKPKNREKYMER